MPGKLTKQRRVKATGEQGNIIIASLVIVLILSAGMAAMQHKITHVVNISKDMDGRLASTQWNDNGARGFDDPELCNFTDTLDGLGAIPTIAEDSNVTLKSWRLHQGQDDVVLRDENGNSAWITGTSATKVRGRLVGTMIQTLLATGERQSPGGPRMVRIKFRTTYQGHDGRHHFNSGHWGYLELGPDNKPTHCYSRSSARAVCLVSGRSYDPAAPYGERCS